MVCSVILKLMVELKLKCLNNSNGIETLEPGLIWNWVLIPKPSSIPICILTSYFVMFFNGVFGPG